VRREPTATILSDGDVCVYWRLSSRRLNVNVLNAELPPVSLVVITPFSMPPDGSRV
jgi:hypothetical protein